MLQTDKKRQAKYKFSKGGCEPFDFCLELRSGGKKMRYGSMEDWVIEGRGELEEQAKGFIYGE
jgi:hypothetical protein